MALFEPTKYVTTDTNGNNLFGINRYQTKTDERRGFLRTAEPQTAVAVLNSSAVLRTETQNNLDRPLSAANNQQLNAPAATIQRGIDTYRRNNELNSRNTTQQYQRPDIFQRTFQGTLSQQQATAAPALSVGAIGSPTIFSRTNRAVEQYRNLGLAVNTTNDLLNRGLNVYQKTLNLAPALLVTHPRTGGIGGQTVLEIPQALNTTMSRGITEYLIFNATTEKNTNSFDLYLKAGPMRLLETQLFV